MASHNLESIEHSITKLTDHFNARMADFQQVIQSSIPATSPSSNIAAQFGAFRVFVMSSLESLQLQVQVLSKHYDSMEMRTRKKMLLVHGISEVQKENVMSTVVSTLSQHLELPDLNVTDIKYSKRIGQFQNGKVRAILIKFCDLSLRNKIWFLKTRLKGKGITLSEFLTKDRHEAFQTARLKFGVARCWTRDGNITVLDSDGKRHHVSTVAEVKLIGAKPGSIAVTAVEASVPADHISPATSQATVVAGISNAAASVTRSVRVQASKSRRDVRK